MNFTAKSQGRKDIIFEKKSIRAAKMHCHKLFPNRDKILKTEDGKTFIFDTEWWEMDQEFKSNLFSAGVGR